MVRKKISLLLATIMTTSVLSTVFNKEIITYDEIVSVSKNGCCI